MWPSVSDTTSTSLVGRGCSVRHRRPLVSHTHDNCYLGFPLPFGDPRRPSFPIKKEEEEEEKKRRRKNRGVLLLYSFFSFFFSSRRRHTILTCDWSSDVCSSDLETLIK